MSLFTPIELPCPECDAPTPFQQYSAVNGDRRPDFREAILDNTFGEGTCTACGVKFRLDPELTYFDEALGLWILVRPFEDQLRWPESEQSTQAVWAQTFGPFAPETMMETGAHLQNRVVFGWAALREKLLCAQEGIDDVALEIAKVAMMAKGHGDPVSDQTCLRLAVVGEETLELVWLMGQLEIAVEGLELPRGLLQVIAEEPEVFEDIRAEIAGDFYVDMYRYMLELPA